MRYIRKEHWSIILQTGALWFVITAAVFPFGRFHSNELDRLPHALQSYNPNWLPTDWYLNLKANPYQAFDALLGPLVDAFGFQRGVVVGRLSVYLLVAIALGHFLRTLKLWFTLGLVVAFIFFRHQSLVAGEWIAGGVEAKTVAYACVLLSLSYALREQAQKAAFYAGLAISLHLLVGCFSCFCLALAAKWQYRIAYRDWPQIRPVTGWLFAGGTFGWIHLLHRLILAGGEHDHVFAGLVYVVGRNPHHLLPAAWPPGFWGAYLALAMCLFILLMWRGTTSQVRIIGSYAAASILLFLCGLLLFVCQLIPFLKYYWFRLADVMIPLLCLLLAACALQTLLTKLHRQMPQMSYLWHNQLLAHGLGSVIIIVTLAFSGWQIRTPPQRPNGPPLSLLNKRAKPMLAWIAQHTPQEAVFLVDPLLWDFYIEAKRAMFVSAKHVPNLNGDILEWFERLKLCNGGRQPEHVDIRALLELHRNFYQLSPHSLRNMAQTYNLHYYLGKTTHPLPFESVQSIDGYTLYRITPEPQITQTLSLHWR